MKFLFLTSVYVVYLIIYEVFAFAQQEALDGTAGIVQGQIVDTSPTQNSIPDARVVIISTDGTEYETTTNSSGEYEKSNLPPGRYLVSAYKDGYYSRVGRPVTVTAAGGDQYVLKHYVLLKLDKKNLVNFFQRNSFPLWILSLCFIAILLIANLVTIILPKIRTTH